MLNAAALKSIGCLSTIALLAQPLMADASQRPGLPQPVLTSNRLFAIPFYLNPNSRTPQRVVLFVSGDKGQSWTLYQRRTAQFRKFDFHAGEDGEYWFVVRTAEQPHPNAVTLPEKIVIVDQQKPELDMKVELSPDGELTAQWTVNDPNLDAKTFRLEYRQPNDGHWRPVTVSKPPPEASSSYIDDVSWVPPQAEGDLLVRAEVLDDAGNPAVLEKRVRTYPTATARRPTDEASVVDAQPAPRTGPAPASTPSDLTYPKPSAPDLASSSNLPSESTISCQSQEGADCESASQSSN